jgi:hypothetical protein
MNPEIERLNVQLVFWKEALKDAKKRHDTKGVTVSADIIKQIEEELLLLNVV